MTNEELEKQSRAAIKAWCDDPSVRLEYEVRSGDVWYLCNQYKVFDLNTFYYRIAKPKKWYRVAKVKFDDGGFILAQNEGEEEHYETRHWFVRWLDERKYYD